MTPEEEFDAAPTPEAEFDAAPSEPSTEPLPPVVQPGPSDAETRWGRIVSFMSGSPLFGTVADAAGALGVGGRGGSGLRRDAEQATKQFSPTVAGVPVLPVLGSVAATLPAGAARIGTLGVGASRAARVGLQGGIGAVSAADRGGDAGDVALGTGAGLVGGAGGELVGAGLARAGAALRPVAERFANTQAVKALTGTGRMFNVLRQKMGATTDSDFQAIGRDVRESGILTSRGIPQSAEGMSENLQRGLAVEGGTLREVRKLADDMVARRGLSAAERAQSLAAASPEEVARFSKADDALDQLAKLGVTPDDPNIVAVAEAYEKGVKGAARFGEHTKASVMEPTLEKAYDILAQGSPRAGPVSVATTPRSTTLGGTYEGLWGQTSRMQQSAFQPGDAIGDVLSKRELAQGGVRGARSELARQMEVGLPTREAQAHSEAMKNFSRLARLEDVMADTAARAAAKNTVGLMDAQIAQTLGIKGPAAAVALPIMSAARSRANAAAAAYAPTLARAAAPTLGLAGAGARMGAPAVGRDVVNRSVADPLGPLRQYLELDPEQQKAASTDAFRGAP